MRPRWRRRVGSNVSVNGFWCGSFRGGGKREGGRAGAGVGCCVVGAGSRLSFLWFGMLTLFLCFLGKQRKNRGKEVRGTAKNKAATKDKKKK